jgi:hypothetical protein
MYKLFFAAMLALAFLPFENFSQSKTFFQQIAGHWEGTLEYQDYSADKRVKLKTYLTVTPAPDGNSAEFSTVYDDFGRIIKNAEIYKIDLTARKYAAGKSEYQIDSINDGRIVLLGSGQDGERVEPIRTTIVFGGDSLDFLKETRSPWQFRNQLSLKRAAENVLAKRTLSAAQLREDFGVFKRALTTLHPGIYRYQTSESLEKLFAELKAKLKNPLPETEFFKLISQFTSQIYCGHTFQNPNNQDGIFREKLAGGKTYLPFYFTIARGKIIVTENAAPVNLARGSEIKRINGRTAQEIIEKLLTVTHADGRNTLAHRVKQIELIRFEAERYALFDWYFPLFFPLESENFTIEATDSATKKKQTFQMAAMTKAERTAEIEKRYGKAPTYDDGWKFEILENSTARLKIENSITWRLKRIKFKEFLANAFAELREESIKNLVIDLRGNDGGDSNIGFELARYLAREILPPYASTRRLVRNVAPQIDLAKYLDTYSKELKATLQNGVPENSYKKAGNDFYEILPSENTTSYPPVTPADNNFRGQAFVISDASNASATFQFMNYVRENRLATIVGQETGGNRQGINGGNYLFLTLPNSKIETDIPVNFFAPLKPAADESVIPDYRIKPNARDIAAGVDTELNYILKSIK